MATEQPQRSLEVLRFPPVDVSVEYLSITPPDRIAAPIYVRQYTKGQLKRLAPPLESRLASPLTSLPSATAPAPRPEPGTTTTQSSELWASKYAPTEFLDLVSQTRVNREVLTWLQNWGKPAPGPDQEPVAPIALLVGEPGSGKTTLVQVLARLCGYNVVEVNASDDRSARKVQEVLGNAAQSGALFGEARPNLIVFDEMDGAQAGGDEHGAVAELLSHAKSKRLRRPVLCIANDLYSSSLRGLRLAGDRLVQVFRAAPPDAAAVAERLLVVAKREGFRTDRGTMKSLAELCRGDIRVCLNTLQTAVAPGRMRVFRRKHLATLAASGKQAQFNVFTVWNELFHPAAGPRGRRAAPPSTGVRVARLLEECPASDYPLLVLGAHHNYLSQVTQDPDFSKTCAAMEWLSAAHLHEHSRFLPAFLSAVQHYASNPYGNRVEFPSDRIKHQSLARQRRALLHAFLRGSEAAVRLGWTAHTAAQDTLSYALQILHPPPALFKAMSAAATPAPLLEELTGRAVSLGLTFKKAAAAARTFDPLQAFAQVEHELHPEVNVLVTFPDLAKRMDLADEMKALLAREIEIEVLRRPSRVLPQRPEGAIKGGAVSPQQAKSGPKRKGRFQSLVFARGDAPKRTKRKALALRYRFHQGVSNAVRRPVPLDRFL